MENELNKIAIKASLLNKDAHAFLDAFVDVTTVTLSSGEEMLCLALDHFV